MLAVFFGFPPFPGCHGRLQWHHLCLQPDWQQEVIYNAGSCRSLLTERDHSQGIWTHLWECTGGCERHPIDKFLLEKLWCPIPRSECWWHEVCMGSIGEHCFSSLSWGLSIARWTAASSQMMLLTWVWKDQKSLAVSVLGGSTGMNCQGRLDDVLKGGGQPAVGEAPWVVCAVQPHLNPPCAVQCAENAKFLLRASYPEIYNEDILLGAYTKEKLEGRWAQCVLTTVISRP